MNQTARSHIRSSGLALVLVSIWVWGFALNDPLHAAGAESPAEEWMLQVALGSMTWACLACFCVIVCRRLFRDPSVLKFALSTTLLAAIIVSESAAVVFLSASWLHWGPEPTGFGNVWVIILSDNFSSALMLACATSAWMLHEKVLHQKAAIGELRTNLTREKLEFIAARLNPHFLFNSLNSIAELVHLDPDMAERVVLSLSSLLRSTLRECQGHTVTMGEEIELAREYLRIEQIRIRERLTYRFSVNPEAERLEVPRMMLLPLLENAVTHGATRGDGRVKLKVSAQSDERYLNVRVWSSRPDHPSLHKGFGIGLTSLRDRLELLYPGAARVSVTDNESGFTIDIRLPARQAHSVAG